MRLWQYLKKKKKSLAKLQGRRLQVILPVRGQAHSLQLPEEDSCPALLAEGKVSMDNTQLFSLNFQGQSVVFFYY